MKITQSGLLLALDYDTDTQLWHQLSIINYVVGEYVDGRYFWAFSFDLRLGNRYVLLNLFAESVGYY